jgi:hypothetical protein
MPGFNQGGPRGQGAGSGRGLGYCCVPGSMAGNGIKTRMRGRAFGPRTFFSSDPDKHGQRLAFERQSLVAYQAWLQAETEHTRMLLEQLDSASATATQS